jgi:hypothetical protein
MNNKIFFAVSIVFILMLIVVIFLNKNKVNQNDIVLPDDLQNEIRPEITLDAKYQYKDGVHFFVGSVETPTPCYSVRTDINNDGAVKEINIIVQEPEDQDMMCSQVITEQSFRASFAGDRDDLIIATLNGEIVNLNLFEINEAENLEDFIIYNKG